MSVDLKQQRIKRLLEDCKHFNGVQHDCCKAGVAYKDLNPLPCLPRFLNGRTPAPCEKFCLRTEAEAEAEVTEWLQRIERTTRALAAAKNHAKERGFGKGDGGNGNLPCPACGAGTLYYSVASYNGHMHGKCSTSGCVSWME